MEIFICLIIIIAVVIFVLPIYLYVQNGMLARKLRDLEMEIDDVRLAQNKLLSDQKKVITQNIEDKQNIIKELSVKSPVQSISSPTINKIEATKPLKEDLHHVIEPKNIVNEPATSHSQTLEKVKEKIDLNQFENNIHASKAIENNVTTNIQSANTNWFMIIGIVIFVLGIMWLTYYGITSKIIQMWMVIWTVIITGYGISFFGFLRAKVNLSQGVLFGILGNAMTILSLTAGRFVWESISFVDPTVSFVGLLLVVFTSSLYVISLNKPNLLYFTVAFSAIIPFLTNGDSSAPTGLFIYLIFIVISSLSLKSLFKVNYLGIVSLLITALYYLIFSFSPSLNHNLLFTILCIIGVLNIIGQFFYNEIDKNERSVVNILCDVLFYISLIVFSLITGYVDWYSHIGIWIILNLSLNFFFKDQKRILFSLFALIAYFQIFGQYQSINGIVNSIYLATVGLMYFGYEIYLYYSKAEVIESNSSLSFLAILISVFGLTFISQSRELYIFSHIGIWAVLLMILAILTKSATKILLSISALAVYFFIFGDRYVTLMSNFIYLILIFAVFVIYELFNTRNNNENSKISSDNGLLSYIILILTYFVTIWNSVDIAWYQHFGIIAAIMFAINFIKNNPARILIIFIASTIFYLGFANKFGYLDIWMYILVAFIYFANNIYHHYIKDDLYIGIPQLNNVAFIVSTFIISNQLKYEYWQIIFATISVMYLSISMIWTRKEALKKHYFELFLEGFGMGIFSIFYIISKFYGFNWLNEVKNIWIYDITILLTTTFVFLCSIVNLKFLKEYKNSSIITFGYLIPLVLVFNRALILYNSGLQHFNSITIEGLVDGLDYTWLFILISIITFLGLNIYLNWNENKDDSDLKLSNYFESTILSGIILYIIYYFNFSVFKDIYVFLTLTIFTVIGLIEYYYAIFNKFKYFRNMAIVLLTAVILRLFLVDVWTMEMLQRIVTSLVIGLLFILTAFVTQKNISKKPESPSPIIGG